MRLPTAFQADSNGGCDALPTPLPSGFQGLPTVFQHTPHTPRALRALLRGRARAHSALSAARHLQLRRPVPCGGGFPGMNEPAMRKPLAVLAAAVGFALPHAASAESCYGDPCVRARGPESVAGNCGEARGCAYKRRYFK